MQKCKSGWEVNYSRSRDRIEQAAASALRPQAWRHLLKSPTETWKGELVVIHKYKQTNTNTKTGLYWHHFERFVDISKIYRVSQNKCNIAIFSLNLFQRSDYTFSHVFRNQNFKPVPSKHFKHTLSDL